MAEKEKQGEIQLNNQIDAIKIAIAEDLKQLNSGKTDDLKILGLDDKLYKRVTDLLRPVGIRPAKTDKPEVDEDKEQFASQLERRVKKAKFNLPEGGNIYEHALKDVKKNGRPKF